MRLLRFFRPSHQHTAFSATLLLMTTITLSRVIGYIREAYIAYAFGAGLQTDAYVAAFTLPDWLNYIVAGGTASITFISIYSRFLAEKREQDAQKTFSIIITVMTSVLVAGTILAEIFTPQFAGWMFHGFTPEQMRLCVHLTRILLPAQIFFYVGGVVSAVLLSHRLFLFPAFGPLIYNVFIIAGGVVAGHRMGIASLAFGALAGSFAGPFLINALGAAKIGTGYRPSFEVKNPAFREWVRLSIPLMLGVSLVAADDWILRYFASSGVGDIARLNYAKRLFAVPIAILGQAVGQASLPFFSRLFGEKKFDEFAATVNASVYRITAASLLMTGWMMAVAVPLIDLVYRRGHFTFADSESTALYFFWFSLSLALWSCQALYARAFYASGNTLTPMIATSLITLASLPMYAAVIPDAVRHRPRRRLRSRHRRQRLSHRRAPAHSRLSAVRRIELERIRQVSAGRRRFWRIELRSHAQRTARWQPPRRSPGPRARLLNLGRSRCRRTLVAAFGITGRSSQEKTVFISKSCRRRRSRDDGQRQRTLRTICRDGACPVSAGSSNAHHGGDAASRVST